MKQSIFLILAFIVLSSVITGYRDSDIFPFSSECPVPVYRFFNTVRGGHLYTISKAERDHIIKNLPHWMLEGRMFDVYAFQKPGTLAVHRFLNINTGFYFYTISEAERDNILQLPQYNYEGIKFWVFADHSMDTTPVYRLFNHARGSHLYTVSEAERDIVIQHPDWAYEGVAFYCYPHYNRVPATGQTISYWPGDDGDLQTGVQWPEPRFLDNGDLTVTDSLTGLMWTKNADLCGKITWEDALDFCNNLDHAGYDDWHLPNMRELHSLMDFSESSPALHESHPFEDVHTSFQNNLYWSSSTNSYHSVCAWYVDMARGGVRFCQKIETNYVWAVRSISDGDAPVPVTGQTISFRPGDDGDLQRGVTWPVSRFTDNGDQTVMDNFTGLVWSRNASPGGRMLWTDAIDYCNSLEYGGYNDWRLPDIREIHSLIDCGEHDFCLPEGHPFINVQSYLYWSSTSCASFPNARCQTISIASGRVNDYNKTEDFYIWPVRGGQ